MKPYAAIVGMLMALGLTGCRDERAPVQNAGTSPTDAALSDSHDSQVPAMAQVQKRPPQNVATTAPDYASMTDAELKARADKWEAGAQLAYSKRFADALENLRMDKSKSEAELNAELNRIRAEAETVAELAVVSNPTPDAVRTVGRVKTAIDGRMEATVAALQVASELGDTSADNELARMDMSDIDVNSVNFNRRNIARDVARGQRQLGQRKP